MEVRKVAYAPDAPEEFKDFIDRVGSVVRKWRHLHAAILVSSPYPWASVPNGGLRLSYGETVVVVDASALAAVAAAWAALTAGLPRFSVGVRKTLGLLPWGMK